VFRVNERLPLGHSGHWRLQLVVGSMDALTGMPDIHAFPVILDSK
jgi:hypothetical protein